MLDLTEKEKEREVKHKKRKLKNAARRGNKAAWLRDSTQRIRKFRENIVQDRAKNATLCKVLQLNAIGLDMPLAKDRIMNHFQKQADQLQTLQELKQSAGSHAVWTSKYSYTS